MKRPFTEQNSFLRRASLALIISAVLLPVAALAQTHPLFNINSTTQSPFPSDRFTVVDGAQNTGLRVALPFPNCVTNPSDCADVTLLNQLDGFNPQPRLSIPFDGAIDPHSVNSKTVFLLQLPFGFSLGRELEDDALRGFTPNVIGINQVVWDPASFTLFAESDQHLDQDSSYLLIVTTGVHDAAGNPIAASRAFHDLNGGGTHDRQLRAYTEALQHLLDNGRLHRIAPGLDKKQIAAASLFTTESVTSTLESIRDQVKAAAPPVVSFKIGTNGERTVFPLTPDLQISFQPDRPTQPAPPAPPIPASIPLPVAKALGVFPGSIGTLAFGKFSAKTWENADAFIPAVPTRNTVPPQNNEDLFFNLFIPAGPRPTNGWPVAIFGHGFGDSKQGGPFAVASTLAHNGIATIAINVVGHGFGPNGTLTATQSGVTVVLPAGGRGVDQNGDGTFDSTEGATAFFAGPEADIGSRDGLQETVADLMQLVRAIQGGIDADGDGLPDLDANRIYYFGQSFGGIYGTIFLGIEPDVRAGVPNVPGGSIIDIVRLSPTFQLLLTQALAVRTPNLLNTNVKPLFFNDNSPLRNLPPVVNNVPGAIAIQTVEDTNRWLGQAGDPVPWAVFIRKSPLAGEHAKSVIIQFAKGDETVPNPTATALIRSGDLADRATFFRNDLAFALDPQDKTTNPGGFSKNPHTFLTNIGSNADVAAVAVGAQTQIGVFFASDGSLTIDPDGPGPLFEVPINGPLPEALNFIP